ncbi:MAG: CapA family protein, partial [Pyrinomonadaceae bacterium]
MQTLLTGLLSLFFAASCLFLTACSATNIAPPRASAETSSTPFPAAESTITIAAVGDIMLGSTSINETFLPPNDGRDSLKPVAPLLTAADIAFGNLEGPLIDGGIST